MARIVAALILLPVLASAQETFQLPSCNIHCAFYDGRLRCDVLQYTYQPPPRPRGCDLEWGPAVELGPRGGARMLCVGDSVADRASPVLGYGSAWQGAGIACTSAETGLRCVNAEGRGFELSRARLRMF